jgi:hypothetical protein
MKSTRTLALAVAILLALCGVWSLPSVSGQGQENSLVQRVAVLEAQVADLTERVEALEQGQAPPGTSFDVLHLNPLAEFPENPSEGDICVVLDECDGEYFNFFYQYLNGDWLGGCDPIIR